MSQRSGETEVNASVQILKYPYAVADWLVVTVTGLMASCDFFCPDQDAIWNLRLG
jgi:hypothetical protein